MSKQERLMLKKKRWKSCWHGAYYAQRETRTAGCRLDPMLKTDHLRGRIFSLVASGILRSAMRCRRQCFNLPSTGQDPHNEGVI